MSRHYRFAGARALVAALALVLIAGPAAAGESKWYVAAGLGGSELDTTFGFRAPKVFDADDDARSIAVGYQAHRYLGVELGWADLGEFAGAGSVCTETLEGGCVERLAQLGLCAEGFECVAVILPLAAEVESYSLSVLPQWPVTDQLTLYGRAGLVDWEADVRGTSPGFGGRRIETFSDTDLVTGLGVRYRFRGGLGLSAELQRYELDAEVAVAGLSWWF